MTRWYKGIMARFLRTVSTVRLLVLSGVVACLAAAATAIAVAASGSETPAPAPFDCTFGIL